MNIAHNALTAWVTTPMATSLPSAGRAKKASTRTLSYVELHAEVNRLANGLHSLGLGKGDRIGVFLPMTPEIVVALLAIAKIGAVILPLFSGFGAGACVARLNDAEAKALFTADGTFRRGQLVPMKSVADEALAQCPTVEHCIVLRRAGNAVAWSGQDHWYHDWWHSSRRSPRPNEPTQKIC